jgi:hypothetical protein
MAASKKKSPKKTAKKSVKQGYVLQTEDRGAPPIIDKPTVTGDYLKSVVLRVDADFAMAIRKEAKSNGKNITAITRDIFRAMYGKK